MPTQSDYEWLREIVLELRDEVAVLKTWRANQDVRHSAVPQWLFGIISALVSVAMLLLNLYLAGAR